jgi:2,4-dienoyl-CoA reductase-like NADH-dependent reductase (Old Yellow Enzyme family)
MSSGASQPVTDRFRFKTAHDLRSRAEELGLALPFSDEIGVLLEPVTIAGRVVPNRIAAQPMEGCDGELTGAPGDLTRRRYLRFARGGSGLIWFEATSVLAEARANPRQLLLTRDTLPVFRDLVQEIRAAARDRFGPAHTPYLVIQLTHSGRFSKTALPGQRKVASANPFLDREPSLLWTDAELECVRDALVAAARLAADAGFDAVDIKACHGYLLHELLGAHTRADSRYGGRFENRVRLLVETVAAVRAEVPGLAVAVRMNATDGVPYPYGFGVAADGSSAIDLFEPRRLVGLLVDAGCAWLNITAGIPSYVPHIGRPFDRPVAGTAAPPEHPLVGVVRLLDLAHVMQREAGEIPVVATGLSWLRQFWPSVGAAVITRGMAAFAGVGRGMFAYPDAPADLMAHGRLDQTKCCISCSRCTELMRFGSTAGCAVRDHPLYSGLHRETMAARSAGG